MDIDFVARRPSKKSLHEVIRVHPFIYQSTPRQNWQRCPLVSRYKKFPIVSVSISGAGSSRSLPTFPICRLDSSVGDSFDIRRKLRNGSGNGFPIKSFTFCNIRALGWIVKIWNGRWVHRFCWDHVPCIRVIEFWSWRGIDCSGLYVDDV